MDHWKKCLNAEEIGLFGVLNLPKCRASEIYNDSARIITAENAFRYFEPLRHDSRVWQLERQTDGETLTKQMPRLTTLLGLKMSFLQPRSQLESDSALRSCVRRQAVGGDTSNGRGRWPPIFKVGTFYDESTSLSRPLWCILELENTDKCDFDPVGGACGALLDHLARVQGPPSKRIKKGT